MKVLIAEDNDSSRTVLEKIVKYWGYQIFVARDGVESMKYLNELIKPDIALLDWVMPNMTGVELCKLIRENPDLRSIYIIMLTANDQYEDMLVGFESGVDDFLTKPVNADELEDSLNRGKKIILDGISFDDRFDQRYENIKMLLEREGSIVKLESELYRIKNSKDNPK